MRFWNLDFQQLINNLDRDLQYAIRVEGKMDLESVSNYEEVKSSILEKVLIIFLFNPMFFYFISCYLDTFLSMFF